jgi:hypothetical protein
MSTKEREPVLNNYWFDLIATVHSDNGRNSKWAIERALIDARNLYETARAKDAELIQMAVNLTHQRVYEWTDEKFRAVLCTNELAFLSAAKEAGFTISEP